MADVSIGKISSRGQVAIPSDIREKMHLKDGEKVLFVLEGDSLMVKKITSLPLEEIVRPLHEARKKIREDEVVELVHRLRKEQ